MYSGGLILKSEKKRNPHSSLDYQSRGLLAYVKHIAPF
jgi:hypothetical protein